MTCRSIIFRSATVTIMGLNLASCRTTHRDASHIASSGNILDLQRVNNEYLITCIDGATQKLPASVFENMPSSEICSQVSSAECPSTIRYSNGQTLKLPGGNYNYASGRPLKASGTIYFGDERRTIFRSPSGVFSYQDGTQLRSADGNFFYASGQPLKRSSGIYYYPFTKILRQATGALLYPNGMTMRNATSGAQSQASFNYSSGATLRTSAGTFYYSDQNQARVGNILYRRDRSISATPLLLEEKIRDTGGDEYGSLRFSVESTSDFFSISLPKLTPEVSLMFEPQSLEFRMRFLLNNNEAPINLTFDEKGQPRYFIFISTGYPGERIVLSSTALTGELSCRALSVDES